MIKLKYYNGRNVSLKKKKEKNISAPQATPIFIQPIQLSNHNLSRHNFFLLFKIFLNFFPCMIRVIYIKIGTTQDALKY